MGTNPFEIPYFRKVENYNNINAILETVLELGANFLPPPSLYSLVRGQKGRSEILNRRFVIVS